MWELLNDPRVIAAIIGAVFGLLGGFLSPFLKTFFEERSFRRKIAFESLHLKQDSLVARQARLLDDLASAWHELAALGSQVTFYALRLGVYKHDEQDRFFAAARRRLEDEGWEMMNRLRQEIRRSKHLVSDATYEELLKHYDELLELDANILHMAALRDEFPKQAIFELHQKAQQEIPRTIDRVIADVASEIGMSNVSFAMVRQTTSRE